jgi:hypothetical protein
MPPSFRPRTLHHQLAWWPVLASVAVTVAGFLLVSAWLAMQNIADRKQLILTFAQSSRSELEAELRDVFVDVSHRAERWADALELAGRGQGDRTVDALSAPGGRPPARYDLVLYVDVHGVVVRAASARTDAGALNAMAGRQSGDWLGAADEVAALQSALDAHRPTGFSVRRLAEVNRLIGRPDEPSSSKDAPDHYQFVIAVPALVPEEGPLPTGGRRVGAVVAVVSWAPFQALLDQIEVRSRRLGLQTGYAYLADSDANTTIGHKIRGPGRWPSEPNLYGTRVLQEHRLRELRHALAEGPWDEVHSYVFASHPGARPVRKYAALQRIQPPAPLDPLLAWRLGVGVDLPDILWAAVPTSLLVLAVGLTTVLAVFLVSHVVASRASLSVREMTALVDAAADGRFTMIKQGGTNEELSRLHDAISTLIVQLRGHVAFEPLPNPYIVGMPVRTAEMFYGRTGELAWVREQLARPGNELILLAGARRIGKTSLLHSIRRSREALGILPFFFDTQLLMQDVVDDGTFYTAMTGDLLAQLPKVLPELPPPTLDAAAGQAQTITKFVKYVNSRTTLTPVLLFDEFENLDFKLQHGFLSPQVFSYFAALLDSELDVSMVVTGSEHFERRHSRPSASPGSSGVDGLFVKALRRRIGALEVEEALCLLTEPLKGRLTYAPGVQHQILRFAGCHPYYTQDFCHRTVGLLNQRQVGTVTPEVFADVRARMVDNPPPQLEHAWEQLGELRQALVCAFAAGLPGEDDTIDLQNALLALPPGHLERLRRQKTEVHNALRSLEYKDWLQSAPGGFRFRADLCRLWTVREHPPTQLSDSLTRSARTV